MFKCNGYVKREIEAVMVIYNGIVVRIHIRDNNIGKVYSTIPGPFKIVHD